MKIFPGSGIFKVIGLLFFSVVLTTCKPKSKNKLQSPVNRDTISQKGEWTAPDLQSLPTNQTSQLIRYGRELIVRTAYYLGPKGTIASGSNGMNCQNCHINAGLQPYSNCFSAVAATYPVFRPRSGRVESIEFRINDCMQRSLNGKPIDSLGNEMKAMVAFLKWIGKDVRKGDRPKGSGMEELPFMERAADPLKGKIVFILKCQSCHGKNGQGIMQPDGAAFIYPPLWGRNSYNTGAGMYRLTKFAGYIKNSMPFGVSHKNPQLTNEQCWDIAAFVNAQPRPHKPFPEDWPILSRKSFDYPFGPYTDGFSEKQHKFGPFAPIVKALQSRK